MLSSRAVGGLGLMSLLSAASLAATPSGRAGEAKSPFELEIDLDVGRDELTLQVINRSDGPKRIHMATLRSIIVSLHPRMREGDWFYGTGGGYRRSRDPDEDDPDRTVRLEPRQSIGFRFSFVKHDMLRFLPDPSRLNRIEKMLEKAEAVEYSVKLRVKTPGKRGEPVDGPRLSSTIMIHPETLRTMKEARARIDGRDEAERAFEAEIELDVKRDELTLEVINRSDRPKRIHMDTLGSISVSVFMCKGDMKDWRGAGTGFRRTPHPDNADPDWTVRLEPRQSVGFRFSFVKHDVFWFDPNSSTLNNIEKMVQKAGAVPYSARVRVKTPGKGGEPVDGPWLESNTLLIDKETLRALKAARARIDGRAE